ncbi:hypothetical protein FQZ97_1019600 [compost metagenome]
MRACIVIVGPHERRSNALHVFWLDTNTSIGNDNFELRPAIDHHARRIDSDATARFRELYRIGCEVEQNLLHCATVGHHFSRSRIHTMAKRKALLFSLREHDCGTHFSRVAENETLWFNAISASFKPRIIKH